MMPSQPLCSYWAISDAFLISFSKDRLPPVSSVLNRLNLLTFRTMPNRIRGKEVLLWEEILQRWKFFSVIGVIR